MHSSFIYPFLILIITLWHHSNCWYILDLDWSMQTLIIMDISWLSSWLVQFKCQFNENVGGWLGNVRYPFVFTVTFLLSFDMSSNLPKTTYKTQAHICHCPITALSPPYHHPFLFVTVCHFFVTAPKSVALLYATCAKSLPAKGFSIIQAIPENKKQAWFIQYIYFIEERKGKITAPSPPIIAHCHISVPVTFPHFLSPPTDR